MKNIAIVLLLLLFAGHPQERKDYKGVIKEFYTYLFADQVSIGDFSSVYANGTLYYDACLKLKDSLGLLNPIWKEIESRNNNVDKFVTNSYVLEKIKSEFDSLTFGFSLDDIYFVIDNSEASSQGIKFAQFIELSFQDDKKIYFCISNDFPRRILWIWLNNAELLDDIIYKENNPEKLYLVGSVNQNLSPEVLNRPSLDGEVVKSLSSDNHFYYIPNNYSNWCKIFNKEDKNSFLGYMQKKYIVPYDKMSEGLKNKVIVERNP